MIYPQAVQPVGPPLHPLYRANFALGEVSREVSHMLQNQHNLYLENLLRAIALSQALVNDLTEAHQVLLSPESYPQYYPSAPPPQYQYQQLQQGYYQQPQPPQPTGPLSRTPDGRYVVIQPAAQQAAPAPAPAPVPPPRPQPSQQEGEHRWLVGTGVGKNNARPLNSPVTHAPPPPQQAGRETNGEETSARRKRSYASKDGPGTTAERPIELDEDDDSERSNNGANGREKRRHTSNKAGEYGAVVARSPGKVDAVTNANGEQPVTEEGTVSTRHADSDRTSSSAQRDGNVSVAANDRESTVPTTDKVGTTAMTQVTPAGEPQVSEETTVNDEKDRHEALQDSRKVAEQRNAQADDAAVIAQHGTHKEASTDTATEPGRQADGEGSLSVDPAASSTREDESGGEGDQIAAKASNDGTATDEAVAGTRAQGEDADMADAPIEDTSAGDGDESSSVSVED